MMVLLLISGHVESFCMFYWPDTFHLRSQIWQLCIERLVVKDLFCKHVYQMLSGLKTHYCFVKEMPLTTWTCKAAVYNGISAHKLLWHRIRSRRIWYVCFMGGWNFLNFLLIAYAWATVYTGSVIYLNLLWPATTHLLANAQVSAAEFSYPFWFPSGAKSLLDKILDPNPETVSICFKMSLFRKCFGD